MACGPNSRAWRIGGDIYLAPSDSPLDEHGLPSERLLVCTAAALSAFPGAFSFAAAAAC